MNKIVIAIAALVVGLIAAIVIFFAFIRSEADEEFGLTEAGDAATEESADADESADDAYADSDSDSDAGADAASGEAPALDGTWTVASDSEAGYRVVEDLGSVLDFEATGRTSQVTGSIDVAGTSITAGSFEVDVASITSDDDRRDGQFTGDIMNAAEFPTATLVLTAPIELGDTPAPGTAIEATATADLTLRGATNSVTFPVQAQILGDQIEVVGSIDVLFSDYGIANPTNPFVTVRDDGKVEVKLLLSKS